MDIITNSGGIIDISGDNLTYGELRVLLPSTGTSRVPGKIQLLKMGQPVILRANTSRGNLTVYANGFYTYQAGGHSTVFGVDRCVVFLWEFRNNDERKVGEAEYMNMPWAIPLELAGEFRLEHNIDCEEESKSRFSIDAADIERDEALGDPYSPEEKFLEMEARIEEQERLRSAMKTLTPRQRQVIELHFYYDMTVGEIARMLGISQGRVSHHLSSGIESLRKLF